MSKFTKRDFVQCPVFGPPKDFGPNVLPTRADVLRCCQEVRRQKGCLSGKDREPSFGDIADEVGSKLKVIWDSASIPTVSEQRIKECVTNLHKKYTTLKNLLKSKSTTQSKKDEKIASFKEYCSELFNICTCKCVDLSRCSCPKEKKVPVIEHDFFLDQRGERLMGIASVDVSETKKIHKRTERNAKRRRFERGEGRESLTTASASTSSSTINVDLESFFEESEGQGDGDGDNLRPEIRVKLEASSDDDDFNDIPRRLARKKSSQAEDELTAKLSMADGLVPDWDFSSFPCHTVAVERTVRLVTEVSLQSIGPDARDRQIRATLLSRKSVNLFDSKKDFVGAINDSES